MALAADFDFDMAMLVAAVGTPFLLRPRVAILPSHDIPPVSENLMEKRLADTRSSFDGSIERKAVSFRQRSPARWNQAPRELDFNLFVFGKETWRRQLNRLGYSEAARLLQRFNRSRTRTAAAPGRRSVGSAP